MAYQKQTWTDAPSTSSPINATRLNHMEEGIYQASMGGGGGGASSLSELSDVTLESATVGDTLVYNATTQKWENTYKALTCIRKCSKEVLFEMTTVTTTPVTVSEQLPSGHGISFSADDIGFVGCASLSVNGSYSGFTMPVGNVMIIPAGVVSAIVTDCEFRLYILNNTIYVKQISGQVNNPSQIDPVLLTVNLMLYELCL